MTNEELVQLGEEIYEEYINLDAQEKAIKVKKEELRKLIIENQTGDVKFGDITVSVSISKGVALKEGVELATIEKRFGEQGLTRVVEANIDFLRERVEAHDLLQIKETKKILLKKAKKKKGEESSQSVEKGEGIEETPR